MRKRIFFNDKLVQLLSRQNTFNTQYAFNSYNSAFVHVERSLESTSEGKGVFIDNKPKNSFFQIIDRHHEFLKKVLFVILINTKSLLSTWELRYISYFCCFEKIANIELLVNTNQETRENVRSQCKTIPKMNFILRIN